MRLRKSSSEEIADAIDFNARGFYFWLGPIYFEISNNPKLKNLSYLSGNQVHSPFGFKLNNFCFNASYGKPKSPITIKRTDAFSVADCLEYDNEGFYFWIGSYFFEINNLPYEKIKYYSGQKVKTCFGFAQITKNKTFSFNAKWSW